MTNIPDCLYCKHMNSVFSQPPHSGSHGGRLLSLRLIGQCLWMTGIILSFVSERFATLRLHEFVLGEHGNRYEAWGRATN